MIIPEDEDSITARPPRRWWHLATVDITPLRRHRDFRLLFIGRLVSFFGSMISSVAFSYQVYQLTHSVLLVGTLGVSSSPPSSPSRSWVGRLRTREIVAAWCSSARRR